MNIFNRFLNRGSQPRKRSMRQQLDDIEDTIDDLADTLGKMHSDMYDKLSAIQEQGNQHPGIVLGMPSQDGAGFMVLEPLEPLVDLEPVVREEVTDNASDETE